MRMYTLEELNQLTNAELEKKITDLTGNAPKSKTKKAALALMVYNMQPNGQDADESAENKPEKTPEPDTDIADLMGENPSENDTPPVGEDSEPTAPAIDNSAPINADDLSVDEEEDEPAGVVVEPVLPVKAEIESKGTYPTALEVKKALAHTGAGLRFDGEHASVLIYKGSKRTTTTLKQPLKRIVAIAEQLAR